MRKNIYRVLVLLVVLVSSSCNKWLELKPQDGLVREDFWQTKEQLESAVIGAYSSLLDNDLVTNLFLWGELRADMIEPTAMASIDEVNFSNAEILSTNRLVNWNKLYATINYCNTIIDFGPQVLQNDQTLNQTQLNSYLAEARGLRAMMYFYLLKIWGEVPLQLNASASDSKIEQLPKSSKEEVYAQILKDLDFAATNARATYGSNAANKGRLTTYGINALQADVYLWNDRYEECITACDKIIKSSQFGLINGANPSAWFNTLYVAGNSPESIFEFQFSDQALNPWYNFFTQVTRRYTTTEFVSIDLYGSDPVDPLNVRDIRGDGASFRNADLSIWKHIGTGPNTQLSQNSSSRHWFVYRYADILLLKAEALAWTNKGAEALELVKAVRTRAQALSVTEENPDPSSPGEVSDYILKERAREFAFEGKRWFDILRNAKRNNYERLNLITDMIAEIAPPDKQQSMISKYKDAGSHYLPIHLSELQADKLLVQNPFYK